MANANGSSPAAEPLTFEALSALEPGLRDLLAEAKSLHKKKSDTFCANAAWYGYIDTEFEGRGLKSRFVRLVGDHRTPRHPVLSTSEAYDVGGKAIFGALPDCGKNCRCTILMRAMLGD